MTSCASSRTDLQQFLERFGPVRDIYLPLDYFTGEPRGFGYVTFFELADAQKAKTHADGRQLLGRWIHLMYASTKPLRKFFACLITTVVRLRYSFN